MGLSHLMEAVGQEGKFQKFVMFALISTHIPVYWSNVVMSYAAYDPDWCCVYDSSHPRHTTNITTATTNTTLTNTNNDNCIVLSAIQDGGGRHWNDDDYDDNNNCDLQDALHCHTKVYLDDTQASTIVTEWDLACDREWIVKLIITIQMLGIILGAVLAGIASDIWGRKGIYLAACVMCAAFNAFVAAANSWEMFAAIKFFVGFSMGTYMVIDMPYLFEFISQRWRLISAALPVGALGTAVFPLIAWLVHDWVWLHVIIAMLMAVLVIPGFFLPESIRWLTVKGHVAQAVDEAKTIAKFNGKMKEFRTPMAHRIVQDAYESITRQNDLEASQGKRYSYLDLYKRKDTAWLTVRLQCLWLSTSVISQGVLLDVEGLEGDIYINMFLTSIFGVPVAFFAYYANRQLGRRVTTCAFLTLASTATIIALVVNVTSVTDRGHVVAYMAIAVKAMWSGVSIFNTLVTAELFPTELRSYGMGAAQFAYLIGGALASFTIDLDDEATRSFAIMTTMSVISLSIVATMKESEKTTMEDAETSNRSGLNNVLTSNLYQSIGDDAFYSQYPDHLTTNNPHDPKRHIRTNGGKKADGLEYDDGDDREFFYTSFTSLVSNHNNSHSNNIKNSHKNSNNNNNNSNNNCAADGDNEDRPSIPSPTTTNQNDARSDVVTPDVHRSYGSVSSTTPKDQEASNKGE